ncbi:MAG: hypothetical protein J2P17_18105 [Mycobacterium sp.]|nr:hypothetical protein [Mycobacterium sp.]
MAKRPKKTASEHKEERPVAVSLAWVDKLPIPDRPRLAYYGGIAALAAFGFIEFPIAAVITVGHVLAHQHHNKAFAELGEALEQA